MADYKGLQVTFEGDATSLSAALHSIATAAQHAQGELTGIGKGLQQNPRSLDLLRDRVKETGNALEAAKSRVDQFRQGIHQAEGVQKNLSTALSSGRSALKQYVSSNIEAYQRNIKAVEEHKSAMESDARSLDLLEQAGQRGSALWEQYTQSLQGHKSAIEQATAANEAMDQQCMDSAAKFSELSAGIAEYDAEIAKMEQEVHKGEAAIDEWKNKLIEASAAMKGAEFADSGIGSFASNLVSGGKAISGIGDSIWGVEKKILAVAGISALTFGRQMISDVEQYGNSISQLGGYLEISGKQLENMSELALYWGKETQFSAVEASDAMGELAKGGLTEAEIRTGAMKATMDMAAAGGLSMASAAEVAVQAIKTFGLSAEDSTAIADALAGAANKSTAEISDLAQGFKYVGGWASMVNWNINDVSGALALLADHGLRGEMAGTALRNVMQRLGAPTDKAAEVMEQYGIQVRDSSGQMKTAVEIVDELNRAFEGVGDEEKQNALNTIFGARALPAAIALMNEGSEALQQYIDATEKAGYATEMAKNRMSEMGWSLEYLRGEAETAMVNLGKVFEPIVTQGAKALESLLQGFNELSTEEQRSVVQTGLMVAAFGPALSIFGRLATGIGSATLGIGGFVKGISGLGPGVSMTTKLTEGFATSFVTLGSTSNAAMSSATAAVAGLKAAFVGAGIVGAVGLAVAAYMEMSEESRILEDQGRKVGEALSGIRENTTNLAGDLASGARALQDYGDAATSATEDIEAFVDSVKQHNERNEETRETAETSIGMLGQYRTVIEELAGAGSASAEDMAKLEWALEGLEQATGQTYTVEQVLTGQFQDETGAIHDTKDAILALIEAKQAEARVDAYKEMYSDTLKEQIKAEESLTKLREDQTKAQEEYNEVYQKYRDAGYDDEMAKQYAEQATHLQAANEALWEGEGLYNKLSEEAQTYADAMGNAEMEAYKTAEANKNATEQLKQAWESAASSLGTSTNELKNQLGDAGISAEQLKEIGGNAFATLAAQAGGDFGTLVSLIQNYNAQEFEDKYGGIYVEDGELHAANGMRIEWNGSEFVYKQTGVTVDVTQLEPAKQKIDETTKATDRLKSKSTKQTATGNVIEGKATDKTQQFIEKINAMNSKSVTLNANGSATDGSSASNLWNTVNAQNALHDVSVTHTVTVRNVTEKVERAAGGIRTHADGGIRWHAGGSIVNVPGTGYPLDMVGEAGAEAIVPLTNKKYAQPFVDMIAEGVAGLMPRGGDTYVIDGISYLPGSMVERHVEAIFSEARRKARM